MNELLKKLTNTKTIIAIASSLLLIAQTLGLKIDNEKVMIVVNLVLTIGILLGVLNKSGMNTTKMDK